MDEIKEKIEEFKKSLDAQSPLKELIFNCPAVLPAIGLICGLVVQFYFDLHLAVWGGMLTISAVLYIAFLNDFSTPSRFQRDSGRNDLFVFAAAFLCFLCLGTIRLTAFNMPASNDIRVAAKDIPTFAHIKARIISTPMIAENNDWHFAKFFPSSAYTTFIANILEIKTEKGWVNTQGKLKFYINEAANNLNTGDTFQTFCRMDKFSEPDNPGQFNFRRYMQMNGVYLCASVSSEEAIKIYDKQNVKSGIGLKSKINSIAANWLRESDEDENAKLIEALVLGSRAKIDRKLYNDFINTGLVHLVCLSGLNVGIFAGAAWWLSKKAGLLHTGRSIICIIATIIFMLAVPIQSPILRAGIMFLIFCSAKMINQMSKGMNSLAISAIILLLIKPMDILTPSFQLSFLAVAGLLLFYEPITKLYKPIEYVPGVKLLFTPLALGLAAWIAVAPIIAYHFYQVQLLTPIWTVPASLPAVMLIIVGTFKIIITPLLPSVGFIAGHILDFSASALSYMVTFFAKVPFSNLLIGKVSIYIIIVFYILILCWKFLPIKNTKMRFIYPCFIVCFCFPAFIYNKIEKFNTLQLAVLSVGHGQCCVLSAGNGKSYIIDAGSISKGDIGQKIVNPYLNYSGITKIDSVFISHDDIDHFNGLPEITAAHWIGNIFTSNQLIASSSSTAMELKKLYALKPAPEKVTLEDFTIRKLWPIDANQEISDNESSLVLLAEFCGRKILFCSDITQAAQYYLMNLYPQMDIDILITPHHGSQRTTDKNFITFFKPEYIITSCGQSQYDRIKTEMEKFENTYFTNRDGAVFIKLNTKGNISIAGNHFSSQ